MKTARSVTAFLVPWLVAAGAAAQDVRQKEEFLRNARVVEREVIRSGISLPEVVQLDEGGVRGRAAFKSREMFFPEQSVRVGQEVRKGLHDSWKFEVAAYELDKLLGLGMVPVTVERKIEGHRGALIEWIEGVLPEFGAAGAGFGAAAWEDEVAKAWMFDYLAYNIDRTPDNLLVTTGFKVRLIDHSRAFQRFLVPTRPLSRFPREVVRRLRALGAPDLRNTLGPYLTKEEMDALLERRTRLLERVDFLLSSVPEYQVLF